MTRPLEIAILGLSLTSSWGNGHATTYRALLRGLAAEGHRVLFLERDVPWYADHRDLPEPDFCRLELYDDIPGMLARHGAALDRADAVIVGSYVPEGRQLIDTLAARDLRQLCFYDIDTPVTMDLLDRGDEAHLARRQVPLFDSYFSFAGGEVLDRLHRQYGARRPRALYCSVDAERYRPVETPIRWDMGYLGTYSPDRQPGLERLLLEPARQRPDLRFVVAGAQYPRDIDWPANVDRIDHLPPEEHAAFYCAQRFTLNITRDAMRRLGWSPSVRLFEAAACGTAILSDRWQGLDELFPEGEAIVIADGTADALAALTQIPGRRRSDIAQAARTRVLREHTGQARARALAAALMTEPAQVTA
ncbi:glycosyltransferase [Rhodobacteraceae bacterium 2CG4]|uniref:Glycosyltransferase n=1 Tax=Halovulum marinum TaxID=2662447 RepID=A0A6L5YY03_9RHOB|nr:glycosyltransferase [Halovulum marinum]MSU89213.1 glycosyltransferase [Halovulum marinum]